MSATLEATRPAGQKKTFGKSTREVPHHTQKAKKWYPAEDEVQPKKVGSITSTSTGDSKASIPSCLRQCCPTRTQKALGGVEQLWELED
jgi:hypothetical protein